MDREPDVHPNRRPLASRGAWWAKACARFLIDHAVSPNQISVASVGAATLSALAFLAFSAAGSQTVSGLLLIAAGGFIQLRLLCNLLDGMVALGGGKGSPLGELYNDLPDRISDVLILAGAGYGIAAIPHLSAWGPALGWAAAVTAVLTAYIRVLGVSLGTPQLYLGPMAKPHRMAALTAGAVIGGALLLANPAEDELVRASNVIAATLALITVGGIATAIRRTRRIAAHLKGTG